MLLIHFTVATKRGTLDEISGHKSTNLILDFIVFIPFVHMFSLSLAMDLSRKCFCYCSCMSEGGTILP